MPNLGPLAYSVWAVGGGGSKIRIFPPPVRNVQISQFSQFPSYSSHRQFRSFADANMLIF